MHILVFFLLMCVGAESHDDDDRQQLHHVCYRCARDQGRIMESIMAIQYMMETQNAENKELKNEIKTIKEEMLHTIERQNTQNKELKTEIKTMREEMLHKMERQNTEIKELKAEIMNQTTIMKTKEQVRLSNVSSHNTWTVIQRRVDGAVSFNRSWEEYKAGFGDNNGSFWIGLEKLHELTNNIPHVLHIDVMHFDGSRLHAEYSQFRVGSKSESYKLHTSDYSGTAGDGLEYHNGMMFSTPDKDNDHAEIHCAKSNKSGWWFNGCFHVNLNGLYSEDVSRSRKEWTGVQWGTSRTVGTKPFKFAEMKMRPHWTSVTLHSA